MDSDNTQKGEGSKQKNKKQAKQKSSPNHARAKRQREDYTESESDYQDDLETIKSMIKAQAKELKKITPTLLEIKTTNSNIESSIAFLTTQNEELKKKLEILENQSKRDKDHIALLEDKIEDLQRENRKANVEIKNVPKIPNETKDDLINMVTTLTKNINCEITKKDIKDIYRVRSKKEEKKNTPIIIETSSTILKADLLKSCKSYNIKNKEKLCTKHLGHKQNPDTPIFVAEQLTTKGARLYFLARELTKSKSYKFCWTAYGKVYVRKEETSPIILIKSEAQIQNLTSK